MLRDVLQQVVELQYERRLVPMEDLDVDLLVRTLKVTMSVDGTPALRSKTRNYNRLSAFLMASLTCLFQVGSQEIVRPKGQDLGTVNY